MHKNNPVKFDSRFIIAMVWLVATTGRAGDARYQVLPTEMATIPQDVYVPVVRGKNDPEKIPVRGFLLEVHAVTNAGFLNFVRSHPEWRRSVVSPIFADKGYLAHWKSDLELGSNASNDAPVTNVSWFAARAYAKWKGLRLPTTAEWEVAGGAGFDRAEGKIDPEMQKWINHWVDSPSPQILPAATSGRPDFNGVYNLHGLVWEWVQDFNTEMVTGESRADSGLERNLFCGAGAVGAKNRENYPAFMRTAFRSSLNACYCVGNLGFRCAKSIPEKSK